MRKPWQPFGFAPARSLWPKSRRRSTPICPTLLGRGPEKENVTINMDFYVCEMWIALRVDVPQQH